MSARRKGADELDEASIGRQHGVGEDPECAELAKNSAKKCPHCGHGFAREEKLAAEKTVIQDFYEKGENPKPVTRDRAAYFRLLTAAWVLYFLAKAGAYFWIARHYSLERGLLLRTIVGSGSFYAMLFISIAGSKKIFAALKGRGLLPEGRREARKTGGGKHGEA